MSDIKKEESKIDVLINDHWEYIETLLRMHCEDEETIEKIGFHYQSAFKHGWKHAREV